MRRRAIAVYALVIVCLLDGFWLGQQGVPAQAQDVTPAPWLSIAGPFNFCYRYPETVGCAPAEDKTGDPFVRGYKVDVDRARADCLHWGAVGAVPAAFLTRDAACSGGIRLAGGIYWFSEPARQTPPPLTPSPPVLPIPPAATVSPTLAVTVTETATPTGTLTIPDCAMSITWYVAGDPAMGGLGGEVGQVSWCDACNRGCGTWLWGVSQAQMDEAHDAALRILAGTPEAR